MAKRLFGKGHFAGAAVSLLILVGPLAGIDSVRPASAQSPATKPSPQFPTEMIVKLPAPVPGAGDFPTLSRLRNSNPLDVPPPPPVPSLTEIAPAAGNAPAPAPTPAPAKAAAASTSQQSAQQPAQQPSQQPGQPPAQQPKTAQPKATQPPKVITPSASGQAQPAAQPSTSSALPVAPSVVTLEINRGQLIRLPRPAATVFIANPEVADVQVKSPSIVYVTAKKGGETTLIAVDDDDQVLIEARVVVSHNLARLRDGLKAVAPSRQVEVSSVGEQLVLEGLVGSPTESEDIRRMASAIVGDDRRVVNRLRVTGPVQVHLRVRVAELTKEISKQLGFNWTLLRDVVGTTSDLALNFAVANPNAATIANQLQFTGRRGTWDVNTIIDAMDEDNLIKILAQPNLTALSGQTASFLVGGEFPIVVPQGNGTFTIEFKKFGVSLAFQPTVLTDNRINLHVRPEVSDLTENGSITIQGFTIPALATRRAETTVEVPSGQSFAIAGLLRDDVTHNITKWPGLADIPILGALFRSDEFRRRESELVIIVTPYIVEPVASNLVALPTDGFRPPHDLDRIFLGAQWRRDLAPGNTGTAAQRMRAAGPAGFQLE